MSNSAAQPVVIGPPSTDKSKPYQLLKLFEQNPEVKFPAELVSFMLIIALGPLQEILDALISKTVGSSSKPETVNVSVQVNCASDVE